MQDIIELFYNIIKKIEAHTNYPIKIIAFDFDCTLIPFHTTGCYTIHNKDGSINSKIFKDFFPYPEVLKGFIYGLLEKGIQPAITSHSDQRFNNCNIKDMVGGNNLIIPLMRELFQQDDIFNKNNVVAFSHPTDGTFTNKNTHIKRLVQNLNDHDQYKIQNVLLIDDTINNIKCVDNFQSIFSNFRGSGLSFGCNLKSIKNYIEMLNKQVDIQIRDNYGFTCKDSNTFTEQNVTDSKSNIIESNTKDTTTITIHNGSRLILVCGIMMVLMACHLMIYNKNNLG